MRKVIYSYSGTAKDLKFLTSFKKQERQDKEDWKLFGILVAIVLFSGYIATVYQNVN